MAVPQTVLAVGWIPFVVVLVLILLFSFVYIRYFQSKYDSELSSTTVAILSLSTALLTSALVPVDIFLVSYMKDSSGNFKKWANLTENRVDLENTVLYAYYALYITLLVFLFFLLPLVYFYYEEKDEDRPQKKRFCSAFLYTSGFLFVMTILFLVGAFAPILHEMPKQNDTTQWDDIRFLFGQLGNSRAEDALSFVMSTLSLIGFLVLILYTAYGMSAWPMGMIRSHRSAKRELVDIKEQLIETRSQIDAIKNKYRRGKRMSTRDERRIEELEESEHVASRQERHLEQASSSYLSKCFVVCRPFEIVFGILFMLITLLIFISLLLTNIDKAMHSLGYKMGYALPEPKLPNPIDIMLVFCQQVFPLDYVVMAGIIMYFFFSSMCGIKTIGIWFLWIKMYKIRVRKTKPQGLLFMCMTLIFIVLAVNVIIYEVMPQYSTYGNQHYITNTTVTVGNSTNIVYSTASCNAKVMSDDCTMTRMGMLLSRYFFKVWFFGACYYWGSWVFLGMILIGFVVSAFKRRASAIEGEVEDSDFEEEDDELLRV